MPAVRVEAPLQRAVLASLLLLCWLLGWDVCALQLARSWLRRAGLMYRERASVHGGYWKMQLVALPSAKSKAGNEQHLPRVSARYSAAAGSWRKESSLQGCLRTAAGLVDKSSWEQNSGC